VTDLRLFHKQPFQGGVPHTGKRGSRAKKVDKGHTTKKNRAGGQSGIPVKFGGGRGLKREGNLGDLAFKGEGWRI